MSTLFVFTDETGNLDFRPHENRPGISQYYGLGTLVLRERDHVDSLEAELAALRLRLALQGYDMENGFHATVNKQIVRDEVFKVLSKHPIVADVTMLEKAKAQPHIRYSEPTFYKYAWYYHFRQLMQRDGRGVHELVIVAATLGTKAAKLAYREAVTEVVSQCAGPRIKQHVHFWPSASSNMLGAVDYTTWAVSRHYERDDPRALNSIRTRVRSYYNLWGVGKTYYYGPNKRETSAS